MAAISYNNPGTQGTGHGGAMLAQWLMDVNQRESAISNAAKAATYLRKSFGDQAPQVSGISDEHWDNMGAHDQAAWAQGYQDRQALNRMKATTQALTTDAQARAADWQAQSEQRKQGLNDAGVFQSVMKNFAQANQVPGTNVNDDNTPADGSPYGALPKLDPQAVMAQLMAGGMSPTGLAKYGATVKDLAGDAADPENPLQFDKTSVPGSTIVKTKRGAGFQVVPNVDEDAGPKVSPDGNYYHNGKTWVHVKQVGAPAGSKFVNINGAVALMTPDNRVVDWKMENPQTALLNAVTGGGAPPATAPARAAVGGYKIGVTYKGGLTYLGGDPNDQNSWQKSQ